MLSSSRSISTAFQFWSPIQQVYERQKIRSRPLESRGRLPGASKPCSSVSVKSSLKQNPGSLRADVADMKLCILSLEQLFPNHASESPKDPVIDPLTLELIDSNTLILLNKIDSFPPTSSHFEALSRSLSAAGKSWIGRGHEKEFWPVSVKEGTGLREFADGLTKELKKRSARLVFVFERSSR